MKTSFKAITVEQSIEKIFSISVKDKFINDFIAAWNKVMNQDRFDIS